MSSHSAGASHPRSTSAQPWIVVAVLIAGALAIGGALMASSVVLLVIGGVLILAGLIWAAALSGRGASPLSFTDEFPAHTVGPRATTAGDSSPPIDTQPNAPSGPPDYRTVPEVDVTEVSSPPDDRRVFPQLSNLGPEERLRNVEGREVIERAEGDEAESGSSRGVGSGREASRGEGSRHEGGSE